MIDMTVGKDHAGQLDFTEVLLGKGHCRFGGFQCGQWINQYPAGITFNQTGVGQIKATQLIDALIYLKQSTNIIKLGLTPEAWINRVRRLSHNKIIGTGVPNLHAGLAG